MNDSSNIVFEDLFDTLEKDRDGKKFDRVSRITAKSENYHMDMILDFHNLLYPMEANEKYVVALARTLSPDGIMRENEGFYDASRALERSLADDYEYVMYGKVYKFDENKSTQKIQMLISFGGLLMSLEGDPRSLQDFDLGKNYYLLMRKVV